MSGMERSRFFFGIVRRSYSGHDGRAVISVESSVDPTLLNEAKLRCELDPLVWNRVGRYISDESQGDCHDPRCHL
jgi:hypothetical protein